MDPLSWYLALVVSNADPSSTITDDSFEDGYRQVVIEQGPYTPTQNYAVLQIDRPNAPRWVLIEWSIDNVMHTVEP